VILINGSTLCEEQARSRGKNSNPVCYSWIPGLALLARNDGYVVGVIPAEAGIQVWGMLLLSSATKESL
jgi:hypothetical protein